MSERYILKNDTRYTLKAISNFTDKEKMIVVSIINYVRREITDIDILLYVSKQTGYFKSQIKEVLEKYEKSGCIEKKPEC